MEPVTDDATRRRHLAPLDAPDAPTRRPSTAPPPDDAAAEPRRRPPCSALRDGLPPLTDTAAGLADACRALAAATGPVAIDAERASGYRYSSRAYLIQLRREGAGTFLVDPIGFDSLDPLQEVLAGTEWILHAATQDLACLAEVGLVPTALFDTELAGRLLGYPRVGLATLVETLLGYADEEGALRRRLVDPAAARSPGWSTPPSTSRCSSSCATCSPPSSWPPARTSGPARSSTHLRGFTPAVRDEPWRRTSGLHRVRGRAAARRRPRAVGDPRRARPASATSHRAGSSATARSSRPRWRCRPRGPSCSAPAASTGAVPSATPTGGSRPSSAPPRCPRTTCPCARRAPTVRRTPRAWAERDPVAAERLTLARDAISAAVRGARRPGREPRLARHRPSRDVDAPRRPRPRRSPTG